MREEVGRARSRQSFSCQPRKKRGRGSAALPNCSSLMAREIARISNASNLVERVPIWPLELGYAALGKVSRGVQGGKGEERNEIESANVSLNQRYCRDLSNRVDWLGLFVKDDSLHIERSMRFVPFPFSAF